MKRTRKRTTQKPVVPMEVTNMSPIEEKPVVAMDLPEPTLNREEAEKPLTATAPEVRQVDRKEPQISWEKILSGITWPSFQLSERNQELLAAACMGGFITSLVLW